VASKIQTRLHLLSVYALVEAGLLTCLTCMRMRSYKRTDIDRQLAPTK